MLPVSLECPFLIAPSDFSDVYSRYEKKTISITGEQTKYYNVDQN